MALVVLVSVEDSVLTKILKKHVKGGSMTDDKKNVEQPEQEVRVEGHTRRKPERKTGEHSRENEPRRGRSGVQILGGARTGETSIESKTEGGSLETTVELGGPGTDPRDETGRRIFRK